MEALDHKISCKDILKLGTLGTAALMLPLERKARTALTMANRMPSSRLPRPFQVPFGVPEVAKPIRRSRTTDYFKLTMKANRLQILPDGPKTLVYGYNG